MARSLPLCVFLLVLCGCPHTTITSRVNPEFSSREYSSVIVVAPFADLELQDACENSARSRIERLGGKCAVGHEVLFPGRAGFDSLYRQLLEDLKVDAVLIISPTGSGYNETYIPPTSKTTSSVGSGPGGDVWAHSSVTTTGGYNISKPWANCEAHLYDARRGVLVWYSTLKSGGSALSKFKSLAQSIAKKTVEKLAQDGMVVNFSEGKGTVYTPFSDPK